ncbi:hypothetical protein NQ317_001770 [Molorchus minor]|uniref:Uncharacterized protein n=1 Tax=Molorchus minor TaxID=1323400 RepID=A0ABQ9JHV8_9CUCU|nr:hypothetical protein NQ317_001770 [Molorchus minor]
MKAVQEHFKVSIGKQLKCEHIQGFQDLIKTIKDPEKPNTLEELNVVYEDGIKVKDPPWEKLT